MAEYRLTTLNLDDDCRAILAQQDNQSRYARECILRYAQVVEDLDRLEDRYIRLHAGSNRLAELLNDGIHYGWTLDDVLNKWLQITTLELEKMFTEGYLAEAIRAEVSRPSRS